MLPPGRARLATRPVLTGSPVTQTIGSVDVARCAASVIGVPGVRRTSTWRARSSAMSPGTRSGFPSAYRSSSTRLRPTTYPKSVRFELTNSLGPRILLDDPAEHLYD